VALTTQQEIDGLAKRIRHAYHARGMKWNDGCSTTRVWTAAALVLSQIHEDHPEIPVDPELFVASQSLDSNIADAWRDLTSETAVESYRKRVGAIIRQLERELRREVKHAERQLRSGRPISNVLYDEDARLSPLGRYIVARRAVQPELAARFKFEAVVQHRCCPLYRSACLAFLPAEHYPVDESHPEYELTLRANADAPVHSLVASRN
jgi:hypothetical protein